jgi:hypothetical protein
MIESVSGYSTSGLLMMHDGVCQALAVDDNLPMNADKIYEVRHYQDWRRWADTLEAELDKRKVNYSKIAW